MNHKSKFPKETNEDGTIAFLDFSMVPILFGIELTSFKMEFHMVICLPGYFTCHTIPRFNLTLYTLATLVPISTMKNKLIIHFYHGTDFKSKLSARIFFSALQLLVSSEYYSA